MRNGDADKRAEKPEPNRKDSGGTVTDTDEGRQTRTARHEQVGIEEGMLLEKVLERENVLAAYRRVKANSGAAGIDGMTVEDLMPHCQMHWTRVRQELLDETYRPQPVRKVDIPKPDGRDTDAGHSDRDGPDDSTGSASGSPTLWDRTFSEDSYGYRPGRSAQKAVVRAREHIRAGHRWVVDLDIEKFFDRVNHDVLMARVARRIKDKRVLRLIRRYLQAGLMEGGLVSPRAEGTPQGGPLSPLLSNLLLDELDRELEKRGHRFVRYADDVNVYIRSEAAGQRGHGIAGMFSGQETPAEGEPGQKRRGAAVEAKVPRVQFHGASRGQTEGFGFVVKTTENEDFGRSREPGEAEASLARSEHSFPSFGVGWLTIAWRRFEAASSDWISGCAAGCGRSCGGSGSGTEHDSGNSLDAVLRPLGLGPRFPTGAGLGGMRAPAI